MKTNKQRILDETTSLMTNFLYYDRKEDPDVPVDFIEDCILNGEISMEEILTVMTVNLSSAVDRREATLNTRRDGTDES